MKRSKAYRSAAEQIDKDKLYSPSEAVALAQSGKVTKFDPTVEVALRLGVDPRKADQMVRGTVNLPNGTGKTARVLVFAQGDRAEQARAGRRRLRGLRRPGGADPGRVPRLRRGRRHPGPDGQGRPARPGARPPWPDAEPEDRHGHPGRGQGRERNQGRQDRVPHRPPGQPALHHRQGLVPGPGAAGELRGRPGRDRSGSSPPRPRAGTSRRPPSPPPWAPASRWTRTRPATWSTTKRPRPSEFFGSIPVRSRYWFGAAGPGHVS